MLYSPEDLRRLEKKKRMWTGLLAFIAGAALLTCAALCLMTTTANAPRMERSVIVLSGAAGCFCLYFRRFAVAETQHEIDHARMLLHDEGTEYAGTLSVTRERLRIRNSVTIRIVTLDEAGKSRRLKIIETRVKRLAPLEGRAVRVRVVNGYIAGAAAL